ncbi:hypothetical protein D3C72_2359000 [compost metagenome]
MPGNERLARGIHGLIVEMRIPQRSALMADFILVEVVICSSLDLGQVSARAHCADLDLATVDQVLNLSHSWILP